MPTPVLAPEVPGLLKQVILRAQAQGSTAIRATTLPGGTWIRPNDGTVAVWTDVLLLLLGTDL